MILPSEGAERNKHVKAAIKGPEGQFVARDWCVRACVLGYNIALSNFVPVLFSSPNIVRVIKSRRMR